MKAIIHLAACSAMAFGALALVGCEDSSSNRLPPGENGTTAGGNGAFGENPEQSGSYNTVTPHDKTTPAPTTQPSAIPDSSQ